MQTEITHPDLNQSSPKVTQPSLSLRDLVNQSGIWRNCHEALADITARVFRMADMPDRVARSLLAITPIIAKKGTMSVAHATIAARLNKDASAVSRYIDALEEWQESSTLRFVSIKRGNKITKGKFCDHWLRHVYAAFQRSVTEGEWSDDWRGKEKSPASRCREMVAAEALSRIPRIKPDTGNDDDLSDEERRKRDEEQHRKQAESARRKAEKIEPRLARILADIEELALVDPFMARVTFDHAIRKFREGSTKVDRRIQDAAFRFMRQDRDHDDDAGGERDDGYSFLQDFDHSEPQEAEAVSPSESSFSLAHSQVRFPVIESEDRDLGQNQHGVEFFDFFEPKTILQTALDFANFGRRILPVFGLRPTGSCECQRGLECPSSGKHPRISNWPSKATTDAAEIRQWFTTRWPLSNLGWAMGDGHLCLDFDGAEGAALHAELNGSGLIEPTLAQVTGGGGLHLVYATPLNFTNKVKLTRGLDLRSKGGMIVIAPSVSSKGAYQWLDGPTEPQPLPRPLLEFLQSKLIDIEQARMEPARQARHSERALNGCSLPSVIPEATRNNTLFFYLSGRRNSEPDAGRLLQIAMDINSSRCTPPLSLIDLKKMVSNICRKYPAREVAYV